MVCLYKFLGFCGGRAIGFRVGVTASLLFLCKQTAPSIAAMATAVGVVDLGGNESCRLFVLQFGRLGLLWLKCFSLRPRVIALRCFTTILVLLARWFYYCTFAVTNNVSLAPSHSLWIPPVPLFGFAILAAGLDAEYFFALEAAAIEPKTNKICVQYNSLFLCSFDVVVEIPFTKGTIPPHACLKRTIDLHLLHIVLFFLLVSGGSDRVKDQEDLRGVPR